MVENLRKMQELRAQIQAQLKLADTLKKLNENAGEDNLVSSARCGSGIAVTTVLTGGKGGGGIGMLV